MDQNPFFIVAFAYHAHSLLCSVILKIYGHMGFLIIQTLFAFIEIWFYFLRQRIGSILLVGSYDWMPYQLVYGAWAFTFGVFVYICRV